MSITPPDGGLEGPLDANPYAPPLAPIGGVPLSTDANLAAAERMRRNYLSHEANLQSIGSLYYLGALLTLVVLVVWAVVFFIESNGQAGPAGIMAYGFYAVIGALLLAMGYGLTKLQPWARWTAVVLAGLPLTLYGLVVLYVLVLSPTPAIPALFGAVICCLIFGYILYLLLSPKSGVVFTHEYKDVIARTPHIKYKTSCILKFALLFFVALIALAIIGGISGMFMWGDDSPRLGSRLGTLGSGGAFGRGALDVGVAEGRPDHASAAELVEVRRGLAHDLLAAKFPADVVLHLGEGGGTSAASAFDEHDVKARGAFENPADLADRQ